MTLLVPRHRAWPIAAACVISTAALLIIAQQAFGQEAPKPDAPTEVPPPAEPAANAPELPKVEIIQDKPKPQPVEDAAPKPKKKPAPVVVETDEPVPAKKSKKKSMKSATSAPAKAKSVAAPPPQETYSKPSPSASEVQAASEARDLAERLNSPNAAEAAAAKLDVKNTTGSALNLSPRETPATVSIVSEKDIEEKGTRGLVETLRSIPGVHVSNNPGEVGTTVTRGFQKATGFAIDGSRVADPVFLPRDFSSFHFDRVELLRGPASVVSGISGLAGTFNIVTKKASTDRTFGEAMISYGSFGTLETGVGLNVAVGPQTAFRTTATFSNSRLCR